MSPAPREAKGTASELDRCRLEASTKLSSWSRDLFEGGFRLPFSTFTFSGSGLHTAILSTEVRGVAAPFPDGCGVPSASIVSTPALGGVEGPDALG